LNWLVTTSLTFKEEKLKAAGVDGELLFLLQAKKTVTKNNNRYFFIDNKLHKNLIIKLRLPK
jgi:hypothetical protein